MSEAKDRAITVADLIRKLMVLEPEAKVTIGYDGYSRAVLGAEPYPDGTVVIEWDD